MAAIPFLWPLFLRIPANRVPYYEEAEFLMDVDAKIASPAKEPQQRLHCLSAAQVLAEVQRAVLSVLGDNVSDSTPLMHAGLDSLGTLTYATILHLKRRQPGCYGFVSLCCHMSAIDKLVLVALLQVCMQVTTI